MLPLHISGKVLKTMNEKELYIELQKTQYNETPYSRMKDWGGGNGNRQRGDFSILA